MPYSSFGLWTDSHESAQCPIRRTPRGLIARLLEPEPGRHAFVRQLALHCFEEPRCLGISRSLFEEAFIHAWAGAHVIEGTVAKKPERTVVVGTRFERGHRDVPPKFQREFFTAFVCAVENGERKLIPLAAAGDVAATNLDDA